MKKITCDTILEFKFLSEPTISPKGTYTAFVTLKSDLEENGYKGDVYIRNNQDGKVRRLTALGPVNTFSWLDDRRIIFLAARNSKVKERIERGEKLTSYYILPVDGGEAEEIFTLPVSSGKIKPIGNNEYILTAQYDNSAPVLEGLSEEEKNKVLEVERRKKYHVFDELPFWSNGAGIVNKKRNRLYHYNSATDKLTPITSPTFSVSGFKVKGNEVLFVGVEYEDVMPIRGGLYLHNLATGGTKTLLGPGKYSIRLFDFYGPKVILNLSEGKTYGNGENGDFYTLDIATGELKLLADHSHHCIGSAIVTDSKLGGGQTYKVEGDNLYYLSTVEEHSNIFALDLVSGEVSKVTNMGLVDSFDIFEGNLVYMAFEGDGIGELYGNFKGVEEQLTHFNEEIFRDYEVITPEYLGVTTTSPLEIGGWVIKPLNYDPTKKYPGILHIHGGPRATFSHVFMHEMQLWSNNGYFVFYCNPRGGEGRGNDFADIRGKYGTIDYEDLMAFTDKVLETYPAIDVERIGVTGGSYGGFMTNWIIGHTNRFKAACAQRSISNWTSFEGTTDIGYFFAPDQVAASHMTNQELQWQQSPLKYAHKVTTPTLFIHGEEDYRCWQVEAFQMFTALKMHGVEARICLLKGENHELSRSGRPLQRIKRLEEILNWFEDHLK